MTRVLRLVACVAVALAAVPADLRAATELQHADDGPCASVLQQPQQGGEKEHWRERFSEWLRRHATRDPGERGSYYFRSPLLTAFGLRAQPDCGADDEAKKAEEIAFVAPPQACVAIVVKTRNDAHMFMELPLPQLGARDPEALVLAVEASLARGESVRIYDHDGNPLTLDPAFAREVQSETCG